MQSQSARRSVVAANLWARAATWLATLIMAASPLLLALPLGTAQASAPTVEISPASGQVGQRVRVTGSGFTPRERVQLTWEATGAGRSLRTGRDGRWELSLRIPAVAPGTHQLIAVGDAVGADGRPNRAVGQVTVLSTDAEGAVPSVAPTGAQPDPRVTDSPLPSGSATASPQPASPTASAPEPTTGASQSATPSPPPAATATPAPTAPPAPATPARGFVTRSGEQLMLGGRAYRFTGLNIYNANSRWTCSYDLASGNALGASLDRIGGGQEAFRAWFFQFLATGPGGSRDWSAFDNTLAAAAARGQRVIVTLGNQWGDCEVPYPADGPYKTEAWYRSGYRSAPDSPHVSRTYRDWVVEVVTRYRDHTGILMWQLMNEAEARTSETGACTESAAESLRTWAADVAALIKSIDPNHLVSIGTMGGGQCGSAGAAYQALHAIPAVDLCEYHDYGDPQATMPGDRWNGLAVRVSQCRALGKPLFVGEVGIRRSAVGGDAVRRAELFRAKFDTWFANGIDGAVIWEWDAGTTLGEYSVPPGDPALGLLREY